MPDLTPELISPEMAAHVAHYYDHSAGYQAGSFTEALIKAIVLADPINRVRLAQGFPGYVAAVILCADTPGGLETVIGISEDGRNE